MSLVTTGTPQRAASSVPFPPASERSGDSPLLAFLNRLHGYIGLFVGPFIFVAALTGTLFVLTPQIENQVYSAQLFNRSSGPAQPLAAQIAVARDYLGGAAAPAAVRPAPAEGWNTRVMFQQPGLRDGELMAVFVDPVTLAVHGSLASYGTSGTLPFRATLDYLHRHLMLGEAGRLYSELAASWLWVAVIGGVLLWATARRRAPGAAMLARSPRLRARRWHVWLGLGLALGLVFFSATGLTWSKWAGERIGSLRQQVGWITPSVDTRLPGMGGMHGQSLAGGHHHGDDAGQMPAAPDAAAPQRYDQVWAAARAGGIDSSYVEIRAARTPQQAWVVREYDRSWPTQVDTVAVDPNSLQIVSQAMFADFPLVAKLIRWGIDTHMGLLFGPLNQLLLVLLGVGVCSMIVLGYRMWWLRARRVATPTLWQSWARLSWRARIGVVVVMAVLGWCLPVMGASLLAFLLLDGLRGGLRWWRPYPAQ